MLDLFADKLFSIVGFIILPLFAFCLILIAFIFTYFLLAFVLQFFGISIPIPYSKKEKKDKED